MATINKPIMSPLSLAMAIYLKYKKSAKGKQDSMSLISIKTAQIGKRNVFEYLFVDTNGSKWVKYLKK